MGKNICIISGKGGSGKTSLAFSFAKSLTQLNKKVLLIDCDMSTHGATYFVKSKIEEYRNANCRILTMDGILCAKEYPMHGFTNTYGEVSIKVNKLNNVLEVDKFLYFLPSNISITNKQRNLSHNYEVFWSFIKNEIQNHVDVIIFDCQAGYSDLSRFILKICDICLLISEPDAVSAAANKTLCFQIGQELENVKTYQIFNKITKEEWEYYSRVTASAFFVNLSPILFNWKVRKEFAISQFPSIESIDLEFGKTIIDILVAILPEYKNELLEYYQRLSKEFKEVLEIKIKESTIAYNKELRRKSFKNIINIVSEVYVMIIPLVIYILNEYWSLNDSTIKNMILTMCILGMSTLILNSHIKNFNSYGHETKIDDIKKLNELMFELKIKDAGVDQTDDSIDEYKIK